MWRNSSHAQATGVFRSAREWLFKAQGTLTRHLEQKSSQQTGVWLSVSVCDSERRGWIVCFETRLKTCGCQTDRDREPERALETCDGIARNDRASSTGSQMRNQGRQFEFEAVCPVTARKRTWERKRGNPNKDRGRKSKPAHQRRKAAVTAWPQQAFPFPVPRRIRTDGQRGSETDRR